MKDPKKVQGAETPDQKDNGTLVEVHMPRCLSVELVQGNDLRHYEIFIALFSVLASTATGFGTARALSGPNGALTASTLAFSVFALLFLCIALYLRQKIYNGDTVRSISLNSF